MEYGAPSEEKRLIPAITMAACVICVIVFVGLGAQGSDLWRETEKWGYISPSRIYDGAWWGLLTSVFVHREIWHIAFNLYWLWFIGGAMERSIGSARYALFFVGAAFVSSSLQLSLGGPGIGMSGVGYATFGFSWIARNKYPELRRIITPQVVRLFLVWMVLCIPLTIIGALNVGNAAHVSGLLFGMLIAALVLQRQPLLTGAALFALISIAVAGLFWAPWSEDWVAAKAITAARHDNDAEALRLFKRSLELGADKSWAWKNIAQIYGLQQNKVGYEDAMRHLRELDPGSARELDEEFGQTSERKIPVPSPGKH